MLFADLCVYGKSIRELFLERFWSSILGFTYNLDDIFCIAWVDFYEIVSLERWKKYTTDSVEFEVDLGNDCLSEGIEAI